MTGVQTCALPIFIARGHAGKINHTCSCVMISVERVKDPFISRTDSKIIASVTS